MSNRRSKKLLILLVVLAVISAVTFAVSRYEKHVDKIIFYRYDGTNCLATVDGEPFAYITRDKVVKLIEAVHGIVLK